MTADFEKIVEEADDIESVDQMLEAFEDQPVDGAEEFGEIILELQHRRSELHVALQTLENLADEHPEARSTMETIFQQQEAKDMPLPEREVKAEKTPTSPAEDPRPDVTELAQPPLDQQ